VESILGQPSRFTFCSRYSVLTDEISRLDKETSILVISCLTDIVANLLLSSDVKSALEKAMTMIGSLLRDLTRSNPRMRILVVHCTPWGVPSDFEKHSQFAMVN
jgi:adenosyl cobinamide kinase/adenosyl cobinamide phosphate guanylyltransferase